VIDLQAQLREMRTHHLGKNGDGGGESA
jgi:hypothetical protein